MSIHQLELKWRLLHDLILGDQLWWAIAYSGSVPYVHYFILYYLVWSVPVIPCCCYVSASKGRRHALASFIHHRWRQQLLIAAAWTACYVRLYINTDLPLPGRNCIAKEASFAYLYGERRAVVCVIFTARCYVERGDATVQCMSSVCPSVRDVQVPWSHS